MSDKHRLAIEALDALRQTCVTFRLDPRRQTAERLYAILDAYGWDWNGAEWRPFVSNP